MDRRSKRPLAIVLHSGSSDRIHHGLSLALAALALGREVRMFFAYWSLGYLKRGGTIEWTSGSTEDQRFHEMVKKGHMEGLDELLDQVRKLGARIYACTNAMGLLNISRDELREEVEKPMGLISFLSETEDHQLVFI